MPATHQTTRLSAGRHHAPEEGACVMELASMLASERFSDHPRSVCPVIAGFLRSYNDHIDPGRRHDLYAYAARAVGTRGGETTERARADRCLEWARAACPPPPLRVRILHRLFRCQGRDVDGVYAARAAAAAHDPDAAHREALELVDELIAMGAEPVGQPESDAPTITRSTGIPVHR